MAELTIEKLIKIILVVFVVIVVIAGLGIFFKKYVISFIKDLGGTAPETGKFILSLLK